MAYRIVEITKPSEVHVTNHQLIVEQEEAKFSIPRWCERFSYVIKMCAIQVVKGRFT